MFKLLSGIVKIALVTLLTGAALSALDVSAAELMTGFGLGSEALLGLVRRGMGWAVHGILFASLIILPLWFAVYVLRPSRG